MGQFLAFQIGIGLQFTESVGWCDFLLKKIKITFVRNELGKRGQPGDLFVCSNLNTVIFLRHSADVLKKPNKLEAGGRIMYGRSSGREDL